MTDTAATNESKQGLTTHVLDTASGVPAAGVVVTVTGPGGVAIQTVTNADGRTDEPLLAELVDGAYLLEYGLGDYFAAGEGTGEAPPYLDVVPIRVNLRAEMGHVHVAVLATRWSYTTYRGS